MTDSLDTRHVPTASRTPVPRAVLWVLMATSVMSIGVLVPMPAIRALLVLPVALVVPGYAAALAIFGPRQHGVAALDIALSALLSAALYPLLALLLYAASIRLSTISVLTATDTLIVVFVGIAALRDRHHRRVEPALAARAGGAAVGASSTADRVWSGWHGATLFTALVAVVVGALALLMPVLPSPVAAPYTQFYVAGDWARVHVIARPHPGSPLVVTVGITNRTHALQRYQVVPLLDNAPTWRGRSVSLRAGRAWSGTVSGPVPAGGCAHELVIGLYAASGNRKIGTLTLWTHDASALPRACIGPIR